MHRADVTDPSLFALCPGFNHFKKIGQVKKHVLGLSRRRPTYDLCSQQKLGMPLSNVDKINLKVVKDDSDIL